MRKAIQSINSSDLIELSGANFKQLVSIDSVGVYAPTSSAVSLIRGWVDINGNLYYENRHGVLVKRTASNVNDKKKSYRMCICGEKFYMGVKLAAVRDYFANKDNPKPTTNVEYGYIVFDDQGNVEELEQDFETHDEALNELKDYLEYWGDTSYSGMVFQVAGKLTQKKTYDYK